MPARLVLLMVVVAMSDEERITPSPGMVGRDEREGPTTIAELADLVRDGFANGLREHAKTRRQVTGLERKLDDAIDRIDVLESHVFPSTPPKALRTRKAQPSLSEIAQEATGDVAELHGRVLGIETRVETIESINKQQSRAMGLAMPGSSLLERMIKLMISREGLKLLGTLAGAAAAIAAAVSSGRASHNAQRAADRPSAGVVADAGAP